MKRAGKYKSGVFYRCLSLAVFLSFFMILAWIYFENLLKANLPLPSTFGNFDRVVRMVTDKPNQKGFSFTVVGDTRSVGTFERIMDVLKHEPLDFMVLLGDCTQRPTLGDHRYLRAELANGEIASPYPMFYVPGNHDITHGKFKLKDFEDLYGPSQFYFSWADSLFIFLHLLPEKDQSSLEPTLAFLERVLQAERSKARRVFVFQHTPPPVSEDYSFKSIAQPERLLELFDRFKVDYVFAGDYHGYARIKRKNTVYVVTGGGGARLIKNKFGAFHHAMILKVTEEGISENILPVSHSRDLEDRLEYYVLAKLWPWANQHLLASMIVIGIMLVSTVAVIVNLIWYLQAAPRAKVR